MKYLSIPLFLFTALLGWGSLGLAENNSDEGLCPKPNREEDLSFSAIKNMIQNKNCQVRSIFDVLKLLPESFRSQYSLFYRSRSLQGPFKTDYKNPRAIVIGTGKSKLIMTFNSGVLLFGSYATNIPLSRRRTNGRSHRSRNCQIGFKYG